MSAPFQRDFLYRHVFVGRDRELKRLRDWFTQPAQRIAFIVGEAGAGKTSLIAKFATTSRALFPEGIYFMDGRGPESPAQFVYRALPKPGKKRALLVIDDPEFLPGDVHQEIRAILAARWNLRLLMAGHQAMSFPDLGQINIPLGQLTEAEFMGLIAKRLSISDKEALRNLWKSFRGSPLVAGLAARTVHEGIHSLPDLVSKLANFQCLGILGPDGKSITTESNQSRKIITEVKEVNDEMLRLIKADPKAIYSLGSRKFEEVIAEILIRQGYHVELTPASKDGGFDMYAARKECLGEFLYLVECKKYAPRHKVGVQIVRALHGVVQQKRATAGVIATTSYFTKGAQEFRDEVVHQMQLADYVGLQSWLSGIIASQDSKPK
jgi:restriction system protein